MNWGKVFFALSAAASVGFLAWLQMERSSEIWRLTLELEAQLDERGPRDLYETARDLRRAIDQPDRTALFLFAVVMLCGAVLDLVGKARLTRWKETFVRIWTWRP